MQHLKYKKKANTKDRTNIKGVVTNYGEGGGGYKTGGGAREVLPLRKGGAEKLLAVLKGGGTKSFGVVFTP